MTDSLSESLAEPQLSAPATRLTYDGPKAPLFKALAESRKHFGKLTTDAKADVSSREGKFLYSFKYAPLNVVLEALEPGLQSAGLALLQPFDGDTLYTIIAFEGSSLTVESGLPEWKTPQELGSALTYLRRYQLKGIFGVADEEDDDGNEASGTKAQVTRKEPTVAPKATSKLSPELSAQVIAKAKEIGLSGQELSEAAKKHAGKPWKDCDDSDAEKLLGVLGAKEVFGKDGAK